MKFRIPKEKFFPFSISILIAAVSIILLQLPLSNVLGFEYSVFISVILSFISGISITLFLKWELKISEISRYLFIFILIPLILGYLNSFVTKNCSLLDGFVFYFVFVCVSLTFGTALGILTFVISKKYSQSIFILIWAAIFLWSIMVYYFSPQLYLFNPIYGFFPGFVYDEEINLSSTILFYQFCVFIISILIISASLLKLNGRVKLQRNLFFFSAIMIVGFIYFSDNLGFSTSLKKLEEKFVKQEIDQRFEFFFENDSVSKIEIEIIRLTTEFHFNYLTDFFKTEPKEKIKIFFFENDESKKKLLGTASADFTKPWQYTIFLTRKNFLDVIGHELAHNFCGEYSKNIFHVADGFNLGLVEGAAMAAEWEWNNKTPHSYAANIFKFIGELNPSAMLRGFTFAFKPSSMSYIISGSFVRFLIDEYGIDKFSQLYASGEYENVYGLTLDELSNQYSKFIKAYEVNSSDSLSALYYFKRQSLFEKECLRNIAKNTKMAYTFLKEKKFSKAEDLFSELWEKVKNPYISYGLLYSKLYQSKFNECIDFYEKENLRSDFNPSYVSSYTIIAYAYALEGELEHALRLLNFSLKLNLNPSFNNSILFRLKIIRSKNMLETYLFSDEEEKVAKIFLTEFKDDIIAMDQFHNYLVLDVKKKYLSKYSKNFYVFENEFYKAIKAYDFELANLILNTLEKSELTVIEDTRLLLMKYIYYRLYQYETH